MTEEKKVKRVEKIIRQKLKIEKEKNIRKTINICGREYELLKDLKMNGGWFIQYGNNGKGKICVGSEWKDKNFRFSRLLHETIEAILTYDNKRFTLEKNSEETGYLFVFDHDYLETLADKIISALLSCKAISIKGKEF